MELEALENNEETYLSSLQVWKTKTKHTKTQSTQQHFSPLTLWESASSTSSGFVNSLV